MAINKIRDDFLVSYKSDEHSDLMTCLEEMEAGAKWEQVELNGTYFIPLSDVSEEALTEGAGEACEDTRASSPLPICAVLPDGRTYLVRPYLLKNFKQHHRDNAAVLGDMLNQGNVAAWCEHISLGRQFLKKKILMLVRGEKVCGWFSEFNANWSQLRQVEFFEEKMKKAFPYMTFSNAEVSHYYTAANYTLDEAICSSSSIAIRPKVMSAYVDAWKTAGLPAEMLEKAVPICQFVTGESGLTSIEVRPYIKLPDGTVIPLGSNLSVNHRGNDEAVWGKFEEFPDKVAVLYQKGLAGIGRLCEHLILHPYCAMTHVLAQFRAYVPAEILRRYAADAEIFWPRDAEGVTCSAIEIFNLVNEMVNEANKKTSPIRSLRNIEMVGRLIYANWDEYDVNTVNKFFSKGDTKIVIPDEDFGI